MSGEDPTGLACTTSGGQDKCTVNGHPNSDGPLSAHGATIFSHSSPPPVSRGLQGLIARAMNGSQSAQNLIKSGAYSQADLMNAAGELGNSLTNAYASGGTAGSLQWSVISFPLSALQCMGMCHGYTPDPNAVTATPQNSPWLFALGTLMPLAAPGAGELAEVAEEPLLIADFDAIQVQSKFKHAPDFGVSGNYNSSRANDFVGAMSNHMDNADRILVHIGKQLT